MANNLTDKLKIYKEAIFGNALYDFIKFLITFSLGGSCVTFLSNIIIDNLNNNLIIKYKIWIIAIIVLFTFFTFLKIYEHKYKLTPSYPSVPSNYIFLKREVSFTYGKDQSHYELDLHVESKINNLNRIHGKYTWSGSGTPTLRCDTKHCNIIPLARKDSFIEYEIELRKNYKKGKKTNCKVIGEMPDPEHTFVPFFSTQILEETKKLVINLNIPLEYNVKEIILEEIPIV